MSDSAIIPVDAQGRDAEGETFDHVAYPESVEQGLLVNEAVFIRYPDGRVMTGNRVTVTPKGLAQLAKELGVPKH